MANIAHFAGLLLEAQAVTIRDIDAGEEPFLYSSGMKGPGYVMVKGLVGNQPVLNQLVEGLAQEVARKAPSIDFVAGNATGGMIPAWILMEELHRIRKRRIPYVYIRGSRKKGGHKEQITGAMNNKFIGEGDVALVVEELVNFAETTCNSAVVLRESGYKVNHAACILTYDHERSRRMLQEHGVSLIHLVTLNDVLTVAEHSGKFPPHVIADYRNFLADPQGWMDKRGFTRDEQGGTL